MQARHTSWLIAALVLLFGLLGALPFHNDAAAPPVSQDYAAAVADGIVWQEAVMGQGVAPPPVAALQATPPADAAVAPVTAITSVAPPSVEVPEIDTEYGALVREYELRQGPPQVSARTPAPIPHAAAKPVTGVGQDDPSRLPPLATSASAPAPRQFAPPIVRSLPTTEPAAQRAPAIAAPPIAAPRVAQTARAEAREHKVRDGDTLATLAQRYLGSADRARDIYEANRDLLRDPELLPIGARLRIPPRTSPITAAPSDLPPTSATAPVANGLSWQMRRLPPTQPMTSQASAASVSRTRLEPLGTVIDN